MASYCVPSFCCANRRGSSSSLNLSKRWHKIPKRLQIIKAQSLQEDGRSSSIVDANLNVLKQRMEMVKVKEQLERCCRSTQNGWNYIDINNNNELYDHQLLKQMKRRTKYKDLISNLVDFSLLVCGTLGFTCLGGTLFLCLLSIVFHLQMQL